MLGRRREPYSIVLGPVTSIAENHDNLLLDVYRHAAEHRPGGGSQRRERIEHELVRRTLAPLPGEYLAVNRGPIRSTR